jgi:hypothetical protein
MVLDAEWVEGEAQSELAEEPSFRVPIRSPKTDGVLGCAADEEAVEVHRGGLGFGSGWCEKKCCGDGRRRESEDASTFGRLDAGVLVRT